ncbi:tyrosine-protein phosphatase [Ferruginibacter sp. SUN106]|uniref:tyrosine-protein phosphatase n=1 Tax=Ferruginibacter sp. SUN106 TaxID=2978348 RepID=UPI003D36E648
MFNFFKKKETAVPDNLPFTTDIHSHILPGIDDGAQDTATSLALIQGLYNLGIRKSIATPHIIGDMYRNTPETIAAALEKAQDACYEAGLDIELSAAAEYMLDDYFLELLKKKDRLLTLHENIILTEISYTSTPENLGEITAGIIAEGYRPVLAHPERYHYYQQNFDEYYHLKEMGFVLQVNILSLAGYYGKRAEKAAKFILEKKLAMMVGTDLHHQKHLDALNHPANKVIFQNLLGTDIYNDLDLIHKIK